MNNLEQAIDIAHRDARRDNFKKKIGFNFEYMSQVNEPVQCVEFPRQLNDAIEFVSALTDTEHYLDYIWNASGNVDEMLKSQGLTEEYFNDMWNKLEKLRTILFGDALNFHHLYRKMYEEIAYHEAYWNAFHEEQSKKKDGEIRRLERKLKEAGIKDE